MKKAISLIFVAILMLCAIGGIGYAETVDKNAAITVFERPEVKDVNELYRRAKAGISDVSIMNMESANLDIELRDVDGKVAHLKAYKTAQLLKKEIEVDGSVSETIAETTIVALDDPMNVSIMQTAGITDGSGSKYGETWDSSMGVKAYITIYYKWKDGALTGYLLTQVTGGWTVVDTSISLSNRSLEFGCVGGVFGGGAANSMQFYAYAPTSNSFSWNTNFTQYIERGVVGAKTSVTLKRGTSSTWTLNLKNYILEN